MIDFFEIDEKKKTVKNLNLDDFSIEDLDRYTEELLNEVNRVKDEIKKKKELRIGAEKLFR
tara:strand:- start:233 stop:415 length:183 start_codon:yes stop_codon:yes gene_type:complete